MDSKYTNVNISVVLETKPITQSWNIMLTVETSVIRGYGMTNTLLNLGALVKLWRWTSLFFLVLHSTTVGNISELVGTMLRTVCLDLLNETV